VPDAGLELTEGVTAHGHGSRQVTSPHGKKKEKNGKKKNRWVMKGGLLRLLSLLIKRALVVEGAFAKETSEFREPTNRCTPQSPTLKGSLPKLPGLV